MANDYNQTPDQVCKKADDRFNKLMGFGMTGIAALTVLKLGAQIRVFWYANILALSYSAAGALRAYLAKLTEDEEFTLDVLRHRERFYPSTVKNIMLFMAIYIFLAALGMNIKLFLVLILLTAAYRFFIKMYDT